MCIRFSSVLVCSITNVTALAFGPFVILHAVFATELNTRKIFSLALHCSISLPAHQLPRFNITVTLMNGNDAVFGISKGLGEILVTVCGVTIMGHFVLKYYRFVS